MLSCDAFIKKATNSDTLKIQDAGYAQFHKQVVLFRILKTKQYVKIDLKQRQAKQAISVNNLCCNFSVHTHTRLKWWKKYFLASLLK